jgi:hypothetical protein
LSGRPSDQAIRLTWRVNVSLPPTATWTIVYAGPPGDQPAPITGLPEPTRTLTLTGLANYTPYTIALTAMLNGAAVLTDTVTVMPTDISLNLPLVRK